MGHQNAMALTARAAHQFEARIERDRKQPLVARFGETPLHQQKTATVTDRQRSGSTTRIRNSLRWLLEEVCEVCQQSGEVKFHHVRKLADLGQPGPLQPQWAKAMANRRRKTLVVCASCHSLAHAGQPATPLMQ